MFNYLKSILSEKGIKRRILAKELNISETALFNKLAGRTEFTLNECLKIKNLLNLNEGLDSLFQNTGSIND